jgi:hypothetical protein
MGKRQYAQRINIEEIRFPMPGSISDEDRDGLSNEIDNYPGELPL